MASDYDLVHYPTYPVPQTLPSSLAAIAQLAGGGAAVSFQRARVLEVGCNSGENLLSLAAMAPAGEFVGFDITASAIERGRRLGAAAGLGNIRFIEGDILDPAVVEGEFDYVIAHGIYTWVPSAVRDALLRLFARHLATDGLAFVSFAVLPGCNIRLALRQIMLDAVRGLDDPMARAEAARARLRLMVDEWEKPAGPLATALRGEAIANLGRPLGATFHDELADAYAPVSLGDLVEHARAHGLTYVADADATVGRELRAPSPAGDALRSAAGGDALKFEQLDDFASARRFRQAIFSRKDVPTAGQPTDPALLDAFFMQAQVVAEGEAGGEWTFLFPEERRISTKNAATAALLTAVADAFPQAVPLSGRLTTEATRITVMRLVFGGLARVYTEPFSFVRTAGERPEASGLVREQARRGDRMLASLHHRPVSAPDPEDIFFIGLLDGTRTREDLARAFADKTGHPPAIAQAMAMHELSQAGSLGLLVG